MISELASVSTAGSSSCPPDSASTGVRVSCAATEAERTSEAQMMVGRSAGACERKAPHEST
eukprot:3348862-Prymnesium_polylepis.2